MATRGALVTRRRRLLICQENQLARCRDLLAHLTARGYIIEQETCLDRCTRCHTCAFALVGGRLVSAPTVEDLVPRLN